MTINEYLLSTFKEEYQMPVYSYMDDVMHDVDKDELDWMVLSSK